jgi:hypothetical protein
MVVRRLYSGHVIVNDYVVPDVKCRDIPMVVRRLYSGNTFYSRDYVIIDYNNARIKSPDDHWYISTFYSQDYVIIDYNIARIKTLDRDIPMVVRRLYSGNVMINDYVVPAVKCRDIPMVVRRLYSGNVIVNDYVVPSVKCRDIPMETPEDHWYISTFYSRNYVIVDNNIARIKNVEICQWSSGVFILGMLLSMIT